MMWKGSGTLCQNLFKFLFLMGLNLSLRCSVLSRLLRFICWWRNMSSNGWSISSSVASRYRSSSKRKGLQVRRKRKRSRMGVVKTRRRVVLNKLLNKQLKRRVKMRRNQRVIKKKRLLQLNKGSSSSKTQKLRRLKRKKRYNREKDLLI